MRAQHLWLSKRCNLCDCLSLSVYVFLIWESHMFVFDTSLLGSLVRTQWARHRFLYPLIIMSTASNELTQPIEPSLRFQFCRAWPGCWTVK